MLIRLFGCKLNAFCCDRTFHEENETNENDGDYGKNKKDIEVRKSRRLLFAQVSESLQRHLFRGDRIASLLKKTGLDLIEVRIHGRTERIEIFAESQTVELIAALLNCLSNGRSDAPAFVAQKREQTDRGVTVLLAGVQNDLWTLLKNVGFDKWFPSERVFPEEDEEFSATLKAVRYAHALRGFDEAGEPVQAAALSGNGDSRHYYYLV